jgi:2-polyprenyl-6-hydroxyphenyl methylase/3-demethylubiquinone-9 3-methyltransferase
VRYARCTACGFLFTADMDAWSDADFAARIYNDGYAAVDPDYRELRPAHNAALLTQMFGAHREGLRVLDYGGGNGELARHLEAAGFASVQTYDPFSPRHAARPSATFDLVVSFEVMEHVPRPLDTFADVLQHVAPGGMLLFSTLVQPEDIAAQGTAWWYLAPRNGHISLHTRASLERSVGVRGYTLASANDNLHVAFRAIPSFARHLLNGT